MSNSHPSTKEYDHCPNHFLHAGKTAPEDPLLSFYSAVRPEHRIQYVRHASSMSGFQAPMPDAYYALP